MLEGGTECDDDDEGDLEDDDEEESAHMYANDENDIDWEQLQSLSGPGGDTGPFVDGQTIFGFWRLCPLG